MKFSWLFSLLFLSTYFVPQPRVHGQDVAEQSLLLHIKKAQGSIKIDGKLSEEDWERADLAKDFWQYFPFDTTLAETKSEARLTYDQQFLYVAFTVYDPVAGPWVTTSLRRDFRGNYNDVISVIFDPFGDQTNGMLFGINPFGVQREGLISGNAGSSGGSLNDRSSSFDLSWDNKWYSASQTYEGYWTAEMAIPFKTLRYKKDSKVWKANFYRLDSKTAERSTWGNIPRNQNIYSLAFSGDLVFEEPLEKPGPNVALIPYVSGLASNDFLEQSDTHWEARAGGDVKVGITPSLNLDLTFNPDFSQVEADVQQTNLTRFELFFPERRQFFLENQDIFASFGSPTTRPFFSRRIGIAEDPATGLNVQNDILFGARLSGRIDKNWRLGVMNMQSAKDASIQLPGYNYSVMALQRQVFARSNISVIGINKQATNSFFAPPPDSVNFSMPSEYNRLVGIDYNLASQDNRWSGKIFYHHSFSPQSDNKGFAHGVSLVYNIPFLKLEWNHQLVGENYNPEVGFTPRTGYTRFAPSAQFIFYPNTKIANHGPGIETEYIRNATYGKTDHRYTAFYEWNFSNTSSLRSSVQNEYTYLFNDFDPTRSGNIPLPEGSEYNYTSIVAEYQSDRRNSVHGNVEALAGQFYNGEVFSISGELNYRFQPFGMATLNFSYSKVMLPEPYASESILLLGPRFDITFSKSVFLTTFFQYNDQLDNVNINARLQYRFKPVSDFFLVYTDNYYATDFKVKNRAIIAKLTYWLNL